MIHFRNQIMPLLGEAIHSTKFRCFVAAFLMFIANSTFAQTYQSEVEIFQKAFGIEKKVAVANFMKMGESDLKFWKIYDKYEIERTKLATERIQIIMEYAESYPNISEAKILGLYNRTQALKQSFDKLQSTYFNEIKKEFGISKAAQFWQLENYFQAIIQAQIYSRIPFIGENLNQK